MYKCKNCDHVFTNDEIENKYDSWGEFEYGTCPCCGEDDFSEAKQCEMCGEWYLPDELHEGVCKDCIAESIDFDTVKEYAEQEGDEERFVNYILSRKEQIDILLNVLKERYEVAKDNPLIPSNGALLDGVQSYVKKDIDSFAYFIAGRKE